MPLIRQKGWTGAIAFKIVDGADFATPETGIATNVVTGAYSKDGGAKVEFNLSVNGRWDEIDATDHPGVYWVDVTGGVTDTAGELIITIRPRSGSAYAACSRSIDIVTHSRTDIIAEVQLVPINAAYMTWNNVDATDVSYTSASFGYRLKDLRTSVAQVRTDIANLNDPTANAVADAIWDELSTGHVASGKAGYQIWNKINALSSLTSQVFQEVDGVIAEVQLVPINAAYMTWNNVDATDVSYTSASFGYRLKDLRTSVAQVRTDIANLNDPTVGAIADAVWDELSTGHVVSGKAGYQVWNKINNLSNVIINEIEPTTDIISNYVVNNIEPSVNAISNIVINHIDPSINGISNIVANNIEPSVNGISNVVINQIEPSINKMSTAIQGISTSIELISNIVINNIDPSVNGISNIVINNIDPSVNGISNIIINSIDPRLKSVSSAVSIIDDQVGDLLNDHVELAIAIVAMDDSIELISNIVINNIDPSVNGISNIVANNIEPSVNAISNVVINQLEPSVNKISTAVQGISTSIKAISNVVINDIDPSVNAISNIVMNHIDPSVNGISNIIINSIDPRLKSVSSAVSIIDDQVGDLLNDHVELAVAIVEINDSVELISNAVINNIDPSVNGISNLVANQIEPSINKMSTAIQGISTSIELISNIVINNIDPSVDGISNIVINQLEPSINKMSTAIQGISTSVELISNIVINNIDPSVDAISNVVINNIDPSVNGISNLVANQIEPSINKMSTAIQGISTSIKLISNIVINNIDPSVDGISNVVANNIEPSVNAISNIVINNIDPSVDGISNIVANELEPSVNKMSTAIQGMSTSVEVISNLIKNDGVAVAATAISNIVDDMMSRKVTIGRTPTFSTVKDCLQLARAQAAGDWTLDTGLNKLLIDDVDGTNIVSMALTPLGGPFTARANSMI